MVNTRKKSKGLLSTNVCSLVITACSNAIPGIPFSRELGSWHPDFPGVLKTQTSGLSLNVGPLQPDSTGHQAAFQLQNTNM